MLLLTLINKGPAKSILVTLKFFWVYHPVCGKWSLDLVTVVGFSYLARKTFLQHLLYGLTCTLNPKFFSEFG